MANGNFIIFAPFCSRWIAKSGGFGFTNPNRAGGKGNFLFCSSRIGKSGGFGFTNPN